MKNLLDKIIEKLIILYLKFENRRLLKKAKKNDHFIYK